MLKLNQSSVFKEEYEIFKNKIEKIENPNFKDELNALLSKLVQEVRNLDILHNELAVTNKLPIGTTDSRNSILSLRHQLIRKLKDWDEFLAQTNNI